jgi:tape measure domain-containing protein
MAKIKITAAEALKELSRLAEEFKKMKASASNASTKSAEDLKKLENRIKKLNSIVGELNKQMAAYETRMNKQQQTTSKTKKAYDALLKSLEANSRELRRNTAAQRSSRIATDKNTAAVNKQNKATSQATRNNKQLANSQVKLTNNNKTMFSGLKSLTKAFGVIAGLTIFKNIALEAFETIKTFDRLKFTMEAITNTSFEIAESQVFLSGITEKFGLNIIDTTQSYIKFLAASKQAEFSVQKTQEIFESTSKAIAILGLGVDDSRSVFLALEQMISKGRVSTEELRRQLGEKLPGAFGIMASALGVTLPQLDDMLKKGEVLSADVLPKFAAALENAYGTEAIDKVDTLVASQNRLTNAWITFQNILAEGKVSKIIKETLNEWAELINSISKSFAQPAKLLDIETKEAVEVQKKLLDKTSKEILDKRQKTGKSSIELDKQIAKATASLKASLTKEEQKVEQDKLDELLRQRSEYNKKLDKFNAERAEKRIQGVVDELRVEEDKLNKLIEFNKKAEAEGKDVQLFGVIPTGITKEEFKEQEKALDNQIKLVAQLRAELIVLRKASEKVKVTPLTPKVGDTKIDTSDLDLVIARLKIAAEVFKKISEDEEQELDTRLDNNRK